MSRHSIRILFAAGLVVGTLATAAAPVVQHHVTPGVVVVADPERCC